MDALQRNLALRREPELAAGEDGHSGGEQPEDSERIDPMEPPRRGVPSDVLTIAGSFLRVGRHLHSVR